MENLIAQTQIAPQGGFKGLGTGLLANPGSNPVSVLATFISNSIGLMTIIAFIWFVYVFVTGAIGIINAGGDKQALESSRKKITTGIVGLVVTIAAIFIIRLIGSILGLDVLNIEALFSQII